MPLSSELVEALTPEAPPPVAVVTEPKDRDGSSMMRWRWTQVMLQGEFADRVIIASETVEQTWHVGVGLVPWHGTELSFQRHPKMEEAANDSGYIWGGVILTSNPLEPRLYEPEANFLSFEQLRFPIVVRHARYEPEVMEVHDPHGLLGTAASWARTTAQNPIVPGCDGCITAEHVIGSGNRGLEISENGQKQPAVAVAFSPPCIDTAFLDVAWPSSHLSAYTPQSHSGVASGDPAIFDGAITGAVSGFVTDVFAHAKYSGSGVPMILCHDGLGARGDSGALVEVHGRPTAMHLGKINLDAGGQQSRGVFLQQICHVMKLDLFR